MAPSLAHFPDLCLETIFKHVPLSDLVYNVGLVCKSWHKSRRTELNKRRRLVLVADGKYETFSDYGIHLFSRGTDLIGRVRRDDGSPWHTIDSLEHIKFNSLIVPGGMQTIFASLQIFCNISRLHLNIACTYLELTEVLQQIDFFSQHLVELKLKNFDFLMALNDDEDAVQVAIQEFADNLFAHLNRLQSLKHLQLDMALENIRFRPEQMVWLSRLTTFAIRTYNFEIELNWIFIALSRHAQNVTSIESYIKLHVRDIPQFDPQLASKFTAMSVYENLFAPVAHGPTLQRFNTMQQFCTRFNSLTKLELCSSFFPMPMTMLARCLSLLTQLVHFELRFGTIPPLEGVQPEGDEEGLEEEEEDEDNHEGEEQIYEEQMEEQLAENAQQQIPQVPSVRLLILMFSANSHLDTERLFIPEIFPNLQVLSLINNHLQCHDCGIGQGGAPHRIENANAELAPRIVECKRLARQPFRRCANLHTIELVDGNEKTVITFNEL